VAEFTSDPGCAVRVRLEEHEAAVLRNLLSEMEALLSSGGPGDPVLERIFPRAYTNESEEKAYRDLTGTELENSKRNALNVLGQGIGDAGAVDLPLSNEEADDWLTALTDLRLAIGTRLDVTEESMSRELDPDDEKSPAMAVLHWLGWMQESMLEIIAGQE